MLGKQSYIKYSYIKYTWDTSQCVFSMHAIIKISEFPSIPTVWSKEFAFEMYLMMHCPSVT